MSGPLGNDRQMPVPVAKEKGRSDVNVVFLLGSARAGDGASDAVALPRLALALLAYVLLDCPGGRTSREEAGAFLWERVDRARQAGMDPGDYFRRSDAHSFFAFLEDAIETGPTGNNLRDLRILISAPQG